MIELCSLQVCLNLHGIQADGVLCLLKPLAKSFGNLQPFTVRKIGGLPSFLSVLASNNVLTMMWSGETLMW